MSYHRWYAVWQPHHGEYLPFIVSEHGSYRGMFRLMEAFYAISVSRDLQYGG